VAVNAQATRFQKVIFVGTAFGGEADHLGMLRQLQKRLLV
jgi:hypothetical protein